jgi:hypothetical protein
LASTGIEDDSPKKKVSKSRLTREKNRGDADYPPLASTGTEDGSPKNKSK